MSYKEHLKEQQNQKMTAGKKSAIARAGRAAKRHPFVKRAFGLLDALQQAQPNSANSMDALETAYRRLLFKDGIDLKTLTGPPFKVGRETLRSDLKRLGIRSWLRSKW